MAARFAAAFVLALALQVATASPLYGCGCGSVGPVPFPTPIVDFAPGPVVDYVAGGPYVDYVAGGPYVDVVGAAPGFVGYETVGPFGAAIGPFGAAVGSYGAAVGSYGAAVGSYGPAIGSYGAAVVEAPAAFLPGPGAYLPGPGPYLPGPGPFLPGPAPVVSTTPSVPVGGLEVVAKSAGPVNSFITPPACQTAKYNLPVQSASSAAVGPIAEATTIVDGCCSTSCAATRAKCSGTTKKVSFKTPVIIDKGSSTSSSVAVVGAPVASRSTKAGTPEVKTNVYPAAGFAGPAVVGDAFYGPGAPYYGGDYFYGAGPAYADVVVGAGAPYYGGEFFGAPGYGYGVDFVGASGPVLSAPASYVLPAPGPTCACACA